MDEKKIRDEMNSVIVKNFQAKNPSSIMRRSCGDNCGPCTCPGGDICATVGGAAIGASAETVGYAGGVAGDLTA